MGPWIWLIPLGFVVGAYGTLIGAGGGFVLVPVLLLVYPHDAPELITSISLAVVFLNATSGSVAYARMKRIDYRSGLLFAAATVPGAILGALTTEHIPRRSFNAILGVVLIVICIYLLLRPRKEAPRHEKPPAGHTTRTIVDREGTRHTFTFRPWVGVVLSLFVGYLSSLLGIGGGIIHVPALVHLLNFPAHIATATSHFILAIMALVGTGVHVATGDFSHGALIALYLGLGAVVGAQLGAGISTRLRGVWIIRGLAIALGFVGVRILVMAL
ncbi:MAG TPA: sulfite exporter TauE/SafE family protein [Planctomycetota bacterium]|nr:sulfite exporter TauE/SafE family protein [Planctomycetota bacterium]